MKVKAPSGASPRLPPQELPDVPTHFAHRVADAAQVPEAASAGKVSTTAAGAAVLKMPAAVPAAEAQRVADELAADPVVEWAVPDHIVSAATLSPTDPQHPNQWSMSDTDVPEAWKTATGKGPVIGVVDSGVSYHPDVAGKTTAGYDFVHDAGLSNDSQAGPTNDRDAQYLDDGNYGDADQCYTGSPAMASNWHGTHVAGIAAAAANGAHTVGVAPDAELHIARALGACSMGYASDVIDSIYWLSGATVSGAKTVARPVDVINLSLGFRSTCVTPLQSAIDYAVGRGVTVVAAAGNENVDAANNAPANCRGVITVGASTQSRTKAGFSNYGTTVDLWAPGASIVSSSHTSTRRVDRTGDTTGTMSGTSMATPFVAGVVALMKQKTPSLTPAEIEERLVHTAMATSAGRLVNPAGAVNIYSFEDVPYTHVFHREITWMAAQGISGGWSTPTGKEYRPSQSIKRDQMAAFLYRMAGSPAYTPPSVSPFEDVSTSHVFYKEIAWMAASKISGGWSTETGKAYRPGNQVLRDQMAAFLYRAAGSPLYQPPLFSSFEDVPTSHVFYKEIAWMADSRISGGWSTGTGKEYRPGNQVLRDQMAAFLYRLDSATTGS